MYAIYSWMQLDREDTNTYQDIVELHITESKYSEIFYRNTARVDYQL